MKITIWIHKSEAISGNITNYHTHGLTQSSNCTDFVQVQISQDEFARLEDGKHEEENLFKDEEAMIPDHNSMYYDVTRNMSPEQIEEAEERGLIIPKVPAGEFDYWFEGLSPIEKERYKLSIKKSR